MCSSNYPHSLSVKWQYFFYYWGKDNSFMTAMTEILGRSHLNIANHRIFPIPHYFRVIYDPERRLHVFPRGVMAHCSKTARRPTLIGKLTACNTLYRLHAKHTSTSSFQAHCFSNSRKLGLSGLPSSRESGHTVMWKCINASEKTNTSIYRVEK